jgi:hypothetical protein
MAVRKGKIAKIDGTREELCKAQIGILALAARRGLQNGKKRIVTLRSNRSLYIRQK